MLVVEPVSNSLAESLPLFAIPENALATEPIELRDAEGFDLLLAADPQLLLDLDLDRQPVSVPARLSLDAHSLHRAIAAEEVFHRPRKNVMNAGSAVSCWRTFKEYE